MEKIITIGNRDFNILDIVVERNSGGRLDKIWMIDKHTRQEFLVKTSTPTGLEPYSEVMAYQIGRALGFDVVEYWLADAKIFNGLLGRTLFCNKVSVCPKIVVQNYKVKTIKQIKDTFNQSEHLRGGNRLFTNTETAKIVMGKRDFDLMLLFDAIIGNKDRHWRNVHLLEDFNGNYHHCPLLDNGDSLLATDVLGCSFRFGSFIGNKFNKSETISHTHDEQVAKITTINTSGVDISLLVNKALNAIHQTLQNLSMGRAVAVSSYVEYRIRKYYGMLRK